MATYKLYTTEVTGNLAVNITDGVAVSSTSTYYSQVFSMRNAAVASIGLRWTGTPTGVLTMWKSNKDDPDRTTDADWIQVTDAFTDPAGGASTTGDELGNFAARLVRLKYVNASGSGTLYGYATTSPRV